MTARHRRGRRGYGRHARTMTRRAHYTLTARHYQQAAATWLAVSAVRRPAVTGTGLFILFLIP